MRTRNLPGITLGADVLQDGTLVWVGSDRSPERAGLAIHFVDPRQGIVRSFGGRGEFDARCLNCLRYAVSRARAGQGLWSISPDRYRIERRGPDGEIESVLQLDDSPWFDMDAEGLRRGGHSPIEYIREDESARLWIVALLREEDPPPGRRSGVGPGFTTDDEPDVTTLVEVVDPARAVVLSRRTFDGYLHLTRDGHCWRHRLDDAGYPYLELCRLTLR